jgi:citronellyl-CoA dehydrogenase
MTSPYTEEHQAFRKVARQFAEKELAPNVDAWERDETFPKWVFERAGALGILGAHYPEDVGGGGGDFWFSVAKSEELPRCGAAGVVMGLLVQSDMATPCIAELGTREQKEEFLRPAIEGQRVAAIGVSDAAAGSDVGGIKTVARKVGDEYVVSGSKTFITNGTRADFVTLLVKTDPNGSYGGISILLFPTDTKGFAVGKKLEKAGNWSSDTAELFFDECRIPARYLLGEEGKGFYYLMQNFQSERVIGCTSALAGSKYALERSVAYGRDRHAFGKPLIKREYWQQKFADLYTKHEAAHALTYRAVEGYNRERHVEKGMLSMETTKLVSMAKVFVGDVTSEIIDQCLQFHGGMGYVEEGWVARSWRDQRLLRIGGGTTEVMRYAIAKILGF